jgi:hypothetical protein
MRKNHDVVTWKTLTDCWKAVGHASALANAIDEIYCNIDSHWIDVRLKEKVGFGLKELRSACDELSTAYKKEHEFATEYEKTLGGSS